MKLSRSGLEALAGTLITALCVLEVQSLRSRAIVVQKEPELQIPLPPLPEQAEAVASYELSASLDVAKHSLRSKGTIEWRNASSKPVQELYVHLYLNAFKHSESAFLRGRKPGGGRGSREVREFGAIDVRSFVVREFGATDLWKTAKNAVDSPQGDETDIQVPLPQEVQPGQTIHIDVDWESKLPSIVERTGFEGNFHMVAQWFPKIARLESDGTFAHFPFHHLAEFYADFGTYDVTIEVPSSYRIAAVGERVWDKVESDRRIEKYHQSDVHDFAFAAWDRFQVRESNAEGVRLSVWYPAGFEQVAQQELEAVEFSLKYFGAEFGRYPYKQLTVVHPPPGAEEAGGMEYPTLITTGGPWYSPRWVAVARGVTVHEFGHQYFYGLVATDEHRWPFLDEGLDSYAEGRALAAGWGPGAFLDLGGMTWEAGGMRVPALESHNGTIIAQPAGHFATAFQYDTLVYFRTATILETLDRVYAGSIRRALAVFARKYRFKHPTPEDLYREVELQSAEASAQLRIALENKGWIDLVVETFRCEAKRSVYGIIDTPPPRRVVTEATATERGNHCDIVVARRGTLSLPVEVEVVATDGRRTRLAWNGSQDTATLPYDGENPIQIVVIDPEHRVLIDEDITNNALRAGGPSQAWRALQAGLHAAHATLGAVTP